MIKITVPTFEYSIDLVEYVLKFSRDTNPEDIFQCKFRYSELKNLDDALRRTQNNIPKFPPTSWFVRTNKDLASIETRKQQLNDYFQQLSENSSAMTSNEVKQFITTGEQRRINQQKIKQFNNKSMSQEVNGIQQHNLNVRLSEQNQVRTQIELQ